jgi:hypothetical protein
MAEAGLAQLADDDFSLVYLHNATAYGFSPRLHADIVVNDLTGTASHREWKPRGDVPILLRIANSGSAGARSDVGLLPRCWGWE